MNEAGLEGVNPSEMDVLSDGITAIVAGADTTATVLTNTLHYLLRYPATMTRIKDEIRKAFLNSQSVYDYVGSVDLPFLDACM